MGATAYLAEANTLGAILALVSGEGSGTWTNEATSASKVGNATLIGTAALTAGGLLGKYLAGNGTSIMAEVAHHASFNSSSDITLGMWIRRPAAAYADNENLMSKRASGPYTLDIDADTAVGGRIEAAGLGRGVDTATGVIQDDVWQFIVMVYEAQVRLQIWMGDIDTAMAVTDTAVSLSGFEPLDFNTEPLTIMGELASGSAVYEEWLKGDGAGAVFFPSALTGVQIEALRQDALVSETPQHTLTTAVVGSGSIVLDPAGGTYDEDTVVEATATPDPGWSFSGWSGDLAGATNPQNVTMTAAKSITATFTEDPTGAVRNVRRAAAWVSGSVRARRAAAWM